MALPFSHLNYCKRSQVIFPQSSARIAQTGLQDDGASDPPASTSQGWDHRRAPCLVHVVLGWNSGLLAWQASTVYTGLRYQSSSCLFDKKELGFNVEDFF